MRAMPTDLKSWHGRPRAHLLFLHTEKTGGSAIECATEGQDMVTQGLLSNLGHATKARVDQCKASCVHFGVVPETVISIREPYSWWRSLYAYAWACSYARVCTKDNFVGFMRRAKSNGEVAQSTYIKRMCGQPCNADYYLHTERLQDDWLSLLTRLGLPLVGLPENGSNPTKSAALSWMDYLHTNPINAIRTTLLGGSGEVPPTFFTQEVVDIIHSLDAPMFSEFRYPKRTDTPFEL